MTFQKPIEKKEAGEDLSKTTAKGGAVPHYLASSFYPATLKNSFTGLVDNGILPPASLVSDPYYKPKVQVQVVNGVLTNDGKLQLEAIKNQFNVKIENLRNPGSTIGLILKIVVFLIVAYLFYIYVIKKKQV